MLTLSVPGPYSPKRELKACRSELMAPFCPTQPGVGLELPLVLQLPVIGGGRLH